MQDAPATNQPTLDVPLKPTKFGRRLKIRQRRPIDGPTTKVSRRSIANYLRLYNKHIEETQSVDAFLPAGHRRAISDLEDSIVSGIHWTAGEKERLFHALARRGKRNVEMVVHDLKGSKSVLEVSGYLHALESELQKCLKHASQSRYPTVSSAGLLAYHQLPIAHEISSVPMARESVFAKHVAERLANQEDRLESRIGWSRIDASTASEIETELSIMTESQLDIMYRTAPDLVTINASAICHETGESVYKSAMEQAYRVMVQKTRQVVRKSIQCAELRTRSERGSYFTPERFRNRDTIGVSDVLYGCAQVFPNIFATDEAVEPSSNEEEDSVMEVDDEGDDDDDDDDDDIQDDESVLDELDAQQVEVSALLDLHDTHLDSLHDIKHRRFLGLLPTNNPVSQPVSRKDLTLLLRHDWKERQQLYHALEDEVDVSR